MNKIMRVLRFWKNVFKDWRYTIWAVVIALVFYLINVFIVEFSNLLRLYSSLGFFGIVEFFFNSAYWFVNSIPIGSYIMLIIISILFGMFISILLYKANMIKGDTSRKTGFLASIGVFISVLAPGCAACGLGIASSLGLSAAIITFLPFDGLELSLLAVVILLIATFKISSDSCKIMLKNERRLK